MASASARLELPATSRIAPLLVAADRCIAPDLMCAAVITRWRQAGNGAAARSPDVWNVGKGPGAARDLRDLHRRRGHGASRPGLGLSLKPRSRAQKICRSCRYLRNSICRNASFNSAFTKYNSEVGFQFLRECRAHDG